METNNIHTFINQVVNENLAQAKETISNELNQKLASALEAKFEEFAPSIFEAAKPDFLDLDKDGDTSEPMKKAAKEAEGDEQEDDETEGEESDEQEEESGSEDEEAEESDEDSEEDEEDSEEEQD
jgi:hypothetical protein